MTLAMESQQTVSAAVLLVDDSAGNLLALEAVLSPLGVRMVAVPTARQAIEQVSREPFAVALIDVQMPEIDGFQLTRRIRELEHGRELPILLVTAIHQDEQFIRQGYAGGAADYITKPYNPEVLRARVKAFVDLYEQREAVRRQQVALRTQERDEAVRRLIAFERIASAALETSDLHALLSELLSAFTGAADAADRATILLRDDDYLSVTASVGNGSPLIDRRVRIGEGLVGTIAAEGRPIELRAKDVEGEGGARALYGVPLFHGGELLGVAYIGSLRSDSFTDEEKRLFQAAAERAALAVGRHVELSSLYEILRAAPALIAIVRSPEWEYTFANPSYQSLLGVELVGSRFRERGLGPEVLDAIQRASQSQETVLLDELSLPPNLSKKSGYIQLSAQPLRSTSGRVDRVLLFGIDVTARVIAQREIDATQLARADLLERERGARLAAERANIMKDEFMATVSHELRTPLNAILGWANLARNKAIADIDHALSVIERNAIAQARIVEDVLDFSRIAQGKLRLNLARVDVEQVVRDATDAVRPAAEAKGLALRVELQTRPRLYADAPRLQQVVWNLLSNAIKFTPRGGQVWLEVESSADQVTITVTDTGLGIDPEFIGCAFDPFRQASGGTTRRHAGLGLGLAIVRQIVQAHGGSIEVSSEGAGSGSRFTVSLPTLAGLAPDTEPGTRLSRASEPRPFISLDGLRILVVDDDEDGRNFLRHELNRRGATVVAVDGSPAALAELGRFRPEVLVSDIAMPDEDGYHLIRQVRALPPELGGTVAAIAVTAHTRRDVHDLAGAAGFQQVVPKPIDVDHLAALLRTLKSSGTSSEPFAQPKVLESH